MARKRTPFTEKNIERMIKEGRGQGEGAKYKPWITVGDLPSLGRSPEILGWKTKRIHHLLSKLEAKYLYNLEWPDSIIDIREQFPLFDEFDSYKETMEIAKQIGVEYPVIPKYRTPNVMTTDFLITLDVNGKKVFKARSTKYAKDLSDRRTLEKLEVERLFWQRRNIDWKLITEKQIDEALAFNVQYLHKSKTLLGYDYITQDMIYLVEEVLRTNKHFNEQSLAVATQNVDSAFGLKDGTSLFIVKHLIANKVWIIDMNRKINTSKPLNLQTVQLQRTKEEVV